MALSKSDEDGRRRLAEVLKIVGTNPALIPSAVNQVLHGESERGRRIYLRNELTQIAKRKIRDAQRRGKRRGVRSTRFTITPAVRLDAWRHEQSLLHGIPEDDR